MLFRHILLNFCFKTTGQANLLVCRETFFRNSNRLYFTVFSIPFSISFGWLLQLSNDRCFIFIGNAFHINQPLIKNNNSIKKYFIAYLKISLNALSAHSSGFLFQKNWSNQSSKIGLTSCILSVENHSS